MEKNFCLEQVSLHLEKECCGYSLVPQESLLTFKIPEDLKQAERKIKLIKGTLATSCASAFGEEKAKVFLKDSNSKGKDVLFCADSLSFPKAENGGIPAVWYAKALEEKDERRQVMDLYNALGTLPQGYHEISLLLQREAHEKVALDFLTAVTALRCEQDDFLREETDSPTVILPDCNLIRSLFLKEWSRTFLGEA